MSDYVVDTRNHDWVTVIDGPQKGLVGIVVRNDACEGVARFCYDVFFGKTGRGGRAELIQLAASQVQGMARPVPPPFSLELIEGKKLDELPVGRMQAVPDWRQQTT